MSTEPTDITGIFPLPPEDDIFESAVADTEASKKNKQHSKKKAKKSDDTPAVIIPEIMDIPTVNRYFTADTWVARADGRYVQMSDIIPSDLQPKETRPVNETILDTGLNPAHASYIVHGGSQLITRVRLRGGGGIQGTANLTVLMAMDRPGEGRELRWVPLHHLEVGTEVVTNLHKDDNGIHFQLGRVETVEPLGIESVYALVPDTDDSAFIANQMVVHIPRV